MKCPNCGKDVSFVICPNCGVNVISYEPDKNKDNSVSSPRSNEEKEKFLEDIFRN